MHYEGLRYSRFHCSNTFGNWSNQMIKEKNQMIKEKKKSSAKTRETDPGSNLTFFVNVQLQHACKYIDFLAERLNESSQETI